MKECPAILKDSPMARELAEAGIAKQDFCKTLCRYRQNK